MQTKCEFISFIVRGTACHDDYIRFTVFLKGGYEIAACICSRACFHADCRRAEVQTVGVKELVGVSPLRSVELTDAEQESIRAESDRLGRFFEFWTKKEALLKCMGKGFHREAKSVEVCGDRFADGEITYYMKTKRFADYTVSVCSVNPDFQMKVEFVDLKSIG